MSVCRTTSSTFLPAHHAVSVLRSSRPETIATGIGWLGASHHSRGSSAKTSTMWTRVSSRRTTNVRWSPLRTKSLEKNISRTTHPTHTRVLDPSGGPRIKNPRRGPVPGPHRVWNVPWGRRGNRLGRVRRAALVSAVPNFRWIDCSQYVSDRTQEVCGQRC